MDNHPNQQFQTWLVGNTGTPFFHHQTVLEGPLASSRFSSRDGLRRRTAGGGLVETEAAGPVVVVVLPLAIVRPQAQRLELVLGVTCPEDLCNEVERKMNRRVSQCQHGRTILSIGHISVRNIQLQHIIYVNKVTLTTLSKIRSDLSSCDSNHTQFRSKETDRL